MKKAIDSALPLTERTVPCPTCAQPSVFAPRNPFRPFCSARCKGLDLGAWANEEFRVPAETPHDDVAFDDPKGQQLQ